jgi:hypothetical protein
VEGGFMRVMFSMYLLAILAGLAFYIAVGVIH